MALSKVRDYISSTITSLDPSFKVLPSPISGDNLPETHAEKSYYIKLDLVASELGQQITQDAVEAEIGFYFKAFKSEIPVYDNSLDLCNTIRLKLLSITNRESFAATDGNPIALVTSDSLTGDVIDSNERQIKITLSANFLINQVIC